MTAIEIIANYLKENGFDGLYSEECGCFLNELAPCDLGIPFECQPGYKCKAELDGEMVDGIGLEKE